VSQPTEPPREVEEYRILIKKLSADLVLQSLTLSLMLIADGRRIWRGGSVYAHPTRGTRGANDQP